MKAVLMTLIAFVSVSATAESSVYELPITREGVTTERVAYNFWSGEWPGPVIRVNSTKKGVTTINAYKSLRVLSNKNKVACTVKNGVYHPWAQIWDNEVTGEKAKTQNSVVTYYTIAAKNEYVVTQTNTPDWIEMYDTNGVELPSPTLDKGSKVLVVYGGEGYCLGSTGGEDYYFPCDAIDQDSNYKQTVTPDDFYEQWLYVQCDEGYNAFVQDSSLLAQPGVSEGEFLEYGISN